MKFAKNLKNSLLLSIARTASSLPFKTKKEPHKAIEYSDMPVEAFTDKYQHPIISAYSDLYGTVLVPIFADYYGHIIALLMATDQYFTKLVYCI